MVLKHNDLLHMDFDGEVIKRLSKFATFSAYFKNLFGDFFFYENHSHIILRKKNESEISHSKIFLRLIFEI